MIAAPAATAFYVYGIVGADAADAVEEGAQRTAAVGGSGVRVVRTRSLAALTSEVSLEEFGEETLRERLNDRSWLEQQARAHEQVLETALSRTSVIPFRFGAIYHDQADVARMLEGRSAEFERALERIAGRVELGVKAYADRHVLETALRARSGDPQSEQPGGAGRAYLVQRQLERRIAAEADAVCARIAADAHEQLLAYAVDGRVNRPQPPELSGRSEQMLLNAAYLVDREGERLAAEVQKLADSNRGLGISFELTGPWPAYNFVGVEEPSA